MSVRSRPYYIKPEGPKVRDLLEVLTLYINHILYIIYHHHHCSLLQ